MEHISGISKAIAKNIVAYREENGKFRNRKELLKVAKLGPKAFEQCAGFMRISLSLIHILPEVLLKVVEAKRLLDTKRVGTVQEAADAVGISRSSFYKYKEDIFPFRDNIKGKILTFVIQLHDEPGLLSDVLKVVAEYGANIQTLHQSIPINGVATLTISVEVLAETGDISKMIETIESREGIQYLKILARE